MKQRSLSSLLCIVSPSSMKTNRAARREPVQDRPRGKSESAWVKVEAESGAINWTFGNPESNCSNCEAADHADRGGIAIAQGLRGAESKHDACNNSAGKHDGMLDKRAARNCHVKYAGAIEAIASVR